MTDSRESDAPSVYHDAADEPAVGRINGARRFDTIALAEPPQVFALYRAEEVDARPQDGIAWWVFAVPGTVYVLSARPGDDSMIKSESLDRVADFWAPMVDADLVAVTGS